MQVNRLKISLIALLLGVPALFLPACQGTSRGSGLLLIAVEGFRADDIQCDDSPMTNRSAFSILCQEFLQVKGMVASSTATLPSMASLLTGLGPQQVKVGTNNDALSAQATTLAERLPLGSWRTAYFFSSPVLSRRSGLFQGYEYVDESVPNRRPLRVVEEIVNSFIEWFDEDAGRYFFATLTLSDLRHPNAETQADNGQTRARTLESQLEELDESLYHLFEVLKKKNRWDPTWIVVVGLQGRTEDPGDLPIHLRLRQDHLIVPAFIKPAQKKDEVTGPGLVEGIWSHAELGQILQKVALEMPTMTMENLGQFVADHKPVFTVSRGCVPQMFAPSVCRYAFFNETAWLTWDQPMVLDSERRRDLLQKVESMPQELIPPRFEATTPIQPIKWRQDQIYEACVREFNRQEGFASLCGSRVIRLLYDLRQLKPIDSREIKNHFIRRWVDLQYARRMYEWNRRNQIGLIPTHEPYAELVAIEKLLALPEFADLKKECDRAAASL